ncbi:misato segment II myosin-like domain-containing protein [Microdochium trichocladiopsis]|uniref:Misato segment II myosin-like domain-containing protein n=1 Tax=Microdochium trichocladiopsis TaxID=1682393 RepID=A0A9P8YH58_9PEZI|nr:misato segment II myosin-like domain-containing protein [Microdochium trichocladiopsis]KAH7038055.1 misato segment II myosin-like domain-containing protein [Microdochium trichocladiopsis]
MREVVTLQFGQQSNYVATHFWNTQESYFTYGADEESPVDHDVHFRPGLGADGNETFMPRTVIYDLKGGFGSMRKINALYDMQDDPVDSSLWSGQPVVHRQQPITPSAYQQSLDAGLAAPELSTSTVKYWSDFSRVYYHPKSIVQLNEFELNSTIMPFEKWHTGEDLFANLDKEHDILDRDLRPFAEESDQMQGLQIITGLDDAWAGFSTRYIERLRDEYGKIPVWVWGVQEPVNGLSREKRILKMTNKARAFAELSSQASLIVPLAVPQVGLPPSIRLDPSSPWHVGALFAAALESTTLYSRLRALGSVNSTSFGTITDLLNVYGKQTIASLSMAVVDPQTQAENRGKKTESALNGRGDDDHEVIAGPDLDDMSAEGSREDSTILDVDLSSPEELDLQSGRRHGRRRAHLFSQILTCRAPPDESDNHQVRGSQRQGEYVRRHRQKVHQLRSTTLFPILDSFPSILRSHDGSAIKDGAALKTSLTTDSSVMNKVRGLRSAVIRYIGVDEREVIGNELAEIAEGYKEGWSSGSDDDDDDL